MFVDRVEGTLKFGLNGEVSDHMIEVPEFTDLNLEIWPVVSIFTVDKLVVTCMNQRKPW
jgi:hypothetical protein